MALDGDSTIVEVGKAVEVLAGSDLEAFRAGVFSAVGWGVGVGY